jgi:hypothetical protein
MARALAVMALFGATAHTASAASASVGARAPPFTPHLLARRCVGARASAHAPAAASPACPAPAAVPPRDMSRAGQRPDAGAPLRAGTYLGHGGSVSYNGGGNDWVAAQTQLLDSVGSAATTVSAISGTACQSGQQARTSSQAP